MLKFSKTNQKARLSANFWSQARRVWIFTFYPVRSQLTTPSYVEHLIYKGNEIRTEKNRVGDGGSDMMRETHSEFRQMQETINGLRGSAGAGLAEVERFRELK